MKKINLQNLKQLSYGLFTIVYISSILSAQNLPKLNDPENPLIVEFAFMLDSDGSLIYWNEGALNESYSDIFGYMIERYALGSHQNWTIGEHANTTL